MKKTKFLMVLLALIATIAFAVSLCACKKSKPDYSVSVDTSISAVIEVGDTVDYTQYFTVTDKKGNRIVVTDEMIDTSLADTSMAGMYTVTLKIGNASQSLTFTVIPKKNNNDNPDNNEGKDSYTVSVDLSKPLVIEVGDTVDFKQYFTITNQSGKQITVTDAMLDTSKVDTTKEGQFTVTLTIGDVSKDLTFTVIPEEDDNGGNSDGNNEGKEAYTITIDTSKPVVIEVGDTIDFKQYFTVTDKNGNQLVVTDAMLDTSKVDTAKAGNFTITLTIGNTSKDLTFTVNPKTYTVTIVTSKPTVIEVGDTVDFKQYFIVKDKNGNNIAVTDAMLDTSKVDTTKEGNFTVTLTIGGTSKDLTFTVNPITADDSAPLQSAMKQVEGAIGLPSIGNYHALVVPVQFSGDTITQAQLNKLNIAFNGTEEQTGWESVKTYYQKTSYGKLNLSFDIQPVYKASKNSSYYEQYKESYKQNGETYTRTGEEVILKEVLAYYESRLDLTNYDTNGDGAIDAVYLVYSAKVDYSNDSFYWAYVTWFYGSEQYDGLDAFYYMFTGFDFMDEDLDKFDGMKINAETYIHETGHLLGLDDYYDYDEESGSNEGLGGADMMDYNKGDHGVYSKIMLGWLTPQIVTSTQTITISSSQAKGDAILVPLDYDGTYFSEYLLIDLYSAQGLNEIASKMENSILYDGAPYGVRIYHVSSWINDPFNNAFGSFTDNNNSSSDIALIKLVEADGRTKFSDTDGYASESDLWQKGDTFSKVFPNYTTNEGKTIIFDITIDSVSANEATITITYNA